MNDELGNPNDEGIEFVIPAEEIIYVNDTNSWVPEMTPEFREMIRKALTKKRPPDNPRASNVS
jgi:hypothetical protein